VKFVDAILSNNSTDDHIREFVRHQGLEPLIKILSLPNLPLDFPSSAACQSIGIVSRSILFLCQEHQLLQQGLLQLTDTLKILEPLNNCLTGSGQSVLLQEVLKSAKPFQAINSYNQTPLLHAMAATQSYVNMFTYVCKSIQNDVRTICINHWGERIEILQKLCQLYSSLVWESSVLLVLCTQESIPDECNALKDDIHRLTELVENDAESSSSESTRHLSDDPGRSSDGSRRLSEDVGPLPGASQTPSDQPGTSTSEGVTAISESQKTKPKVSPKLRLLKHLLAASSRLGRSLAEFFSLLVRRAVGSGQRQRRPQHMVTPAMPTIPGKLIATQLAKLLTHGLSWKDPEECPLPRLNLTFYICSLGFVHPMLFDDRKNPYHLMLQQLVASGGLRALYDRFEWVVNRKTAKLSSAIPAEQSTLPQGSEEFVNAWLSLMERLVNPKLIMDSQHALPAPAEGAATRNGFEPRKFLMSTQKVRVATRCFSSGYSVMSFNGHT
jgi:E3 ubiquitin-protein ligase HUWE1